MKYSPIQFKPFEGLFVIATLIVCSLPIFDSLDGDDDYSHLIIWIYILAAIILGLQLHYEQPRWQLFPNYGVFGMIFVFTLVGAFPFFPSLMDILRWPLTVVSAFGVVLAGAMPRFSLPKPRGPHAVGTCLFYMLDSNRKDANSNVHVEREILAQMWYPCEQGAKDPLVHYADMTDETTQRSRRVLPPFTELRVFRKHLVRFRLPPFLLDHFDGILSRSHDAPENLIYSTLPEEEKKDKKLPILLFSHSLNGMRNQNQYLCEELASEGFVVISIEHTNDAALTIFPDDHMKGHTAEYKEEGVSAGETQKLYQMYSSLLETRVQDIQFIITCLLDPLNKGNPTPVLAYKGYKESLSRRFKNLLDLERIAVCGHSFGASAALAACLKDQRVKLAIGYDAWIWPLPKELIDPSQDSPLRLSQPLLFLQAPKFLDEKEVTTRNNTDLLLTLLERGLSDSKYLVVLKKAKHADFLDVSFYAPLLTFLSGFTGSLSPLLVQDIMVDFTIAFFNSQLPPKKPDMFQNCISPNYLHHDQITVRNF